MKSKEDIKVAIADGSVIMRSGLASVLKHFSEFNFRINEITNQEALTIFLRLHTPDLLIINPLFAIGMNLATIRKTYPSLKIAALTSSLIDNQLLSDYDTTISINDDIETICSKIKEAVNEPDEESSEQDALSAREKEIIGCVKRNDQQGDSRHIVYFNIYGDYAPPQHLKEIADTLHCRSGNLCNCK